MKHSDNQGTGNKLISALMEASVYPHEVESIDLIETHISWVILTGKYAYKIKKPVSLGFLDFSTLSKRKYYCEEELRLNRRLAAEIYLDLVTIRGRLEDPHFDADGEVVEYAVKMRQFPQRAQLDRMLERGELHASHMDALANMVADFHRRVAIAEADSEYGAPQQVLQSVMDTISQLRSHLDAPDSLCLVDELQQWCETSYSLLAPLIEQRKQQGHVRECHGDMHLRNLAWFEDRPLAFDCIEFNPGLRWNDVISEIAFLIMDLDDRNQSPLAQRFLNAYLERSGDYSGVRMLRFYLLYRALVRAMVDAIRLAQPGLDADARQQAQQEAQGYLRLAHSYTQYDQPRLLICHGLSGSGKTTYTQLLLERFAAIRIRSDVERKRLYGLAEESESPPPGNEVLYSHAASERTYQYLRELAQQILLAGYSVIVDATFQSREQRRLFQALADEGGWSFAILDFSASADSLRRRVTARHGDASDANLEVLEQQLLQNHPLEEDEQGDVIHIDSEQAFDADRVVQQITQHR